MKITLSIERMNKIVERALVICEMEMIDGSIDIGNDIKFEELQQVREAFWKKYIVIKRD